MSLVLFVKRTFLYHKISILFLLLNSFNAFSQQDARVAFSLTDNSFKTFRKQSIYILSAQPNFTDTIFPLQWDPAIDDTVFFELKQFKNPVYVEMAADTFKKTSNRFSLVPSHVYNLTEFDDKLVVRSRLLVFDHLDNKARMLYSFAIKLITELIIASLAAALMRLPARLIFFVFVANIMTFPMVFVTFLPYYLNEVVTIILEGLFIFMIGWKRLKITKAMLVSVITNVLRFGIYKLAILVLKLI